MVSTPSASATSISTIGGSAALFLQAGDKGTPTEVAIVLVRPRALMHPLLPSPMKICYILLVHHKLAQARRLVSRLQAPGVSFVIHIDQKVSQPDADGFIASLRPVPDVHYAPRMDATWGSFRLALAIMQSIATAAATADFDRAVLMSGQDYPISSHDAIVEFFRAAPEREYVEAELMDVTRKDLSHWTPYYRFRRHHFWVGKRRLMIPGIERSLPPMPIFHGSTWWALTREAIEYLAYGFVAERRLRRRLQTSFLPDEAYVPTLLMNSPVFAHRVSRHNLTAAEFTADSGPHPKTLVLSDAESLVASPKLFARKFDAAASAELLDWLDATHGKG